MLENNFITHFKNCTLPPKLWTHDAHLFVAFSYLCNHDFLEALQIIRQDIKRFNSSQGKLSSYHDTITIAMMLIVGHRISLMGIDKPKKNIIWLDFKRLNPDLFIWSPPFLEQFYSKKLLGSEAAKAQFIWPDKRGFYKSSQYNSL